MSVLLSEDWDWVRFSCCFGSKTLFSPGSSMCFIGKRALSRNLVRCWFLPWVFDNWEKDEWRTGCLLSSVGPSLWVPSFCARVGLFRMIEPAQSKWFSTQCEVHVWTRLEFVCYTLHIFHFWALPSYCFSFRPALSIQKRMSVWLPGKDLCQSRFLFKILFDFATAVSVSIQ